VLFIFCSFLSSDREDFSIQADRSPSEELSGHWESYQTKMHYSIHKEAALSSGEEISRIATKRGIPGSIKTGKLADILELKGSDYGYQGPWGWESRKK
jgi:hypothetical protein